MDEADKCLGCCCIDCIVEKIGDRFFNFVTDAGKSTRYSARVGIDRNGADNSYILDIGGIFEDFSSGFSFHMTAHAALRPNLP